MLVGSIASICLATAITESAGALRPVYACSKHKRESDEFG
jgi:hypothetical protein